MDMVRAHSLDDHVAKPTVAEFFQDRCHVWQLFAVFDFVASYRRGSDMRSNRFQHTGFNRKDYTCASRNVCLNRCLELEFRAQAILQILGIFADRDGKAIGSSEEN